MESAEAAVLQAWNEYLPWVRLTVSDEVVSVPVAGRRQRWSIAAWSRVPAARLGPGEVLVAANLGRRLRAQMARKGQSYADRRALHLVGDDVLIHLEHVGVGDDEVDRPRRATRQFPPSGVRAVQAMLTTHAADATWTVRRLADEAGLSVGQAHRILSILEQADLVVTQGRGAAGARQVRDRGALLDWLAEQPAARRGPAQWPAHVYGRNGQEVLARAAEGLSRAGCTYAVTGMAAAALADLGPTALTTIHFRVDPQMDLADVAAKAGMTRADRGANVVLWSDADGSGRPDSELVQGIPVAQGPRVYLDLMQLPRGREVAGTYRRVRLGY